MKDKLLRIRSPWRRLLITFFVSIVLLLDSVVKQSPRARVHWLGHANRPRRPERALLLAFFSSAVLMFAIHQDGLWLATWGGITSAFVIVHSFNLIFRTVKGV